MRSQTFQNFFRRLAFLLWRESEAPRNILKELIREVENSAGFVRNDARIKAKAWLIGHVSSMGEEDIRLARMHFGYLLPAEWGLRSKQ
jgi:hypothetical protein